MANGDLEWLPIIDALREARRIAVLTGAGISVESGVPSFRGPGGLWQGDDPRQLATPEAFARDPRRVWEWYEWRRKIVAGCAPNPAHRALVQLERRTPEFTLITQNVDGLHRIAGTSPARLVEFHGSLWTLRCTQCRYQREDRTALEALPPRCPDCGSPLRPGVVWFGEPIPPPTLHRARQAVVCDAMLVVGTHGVVEPAASLSLMARSRGAFVIEINPEPTPLSGHLPSSLRGKAGEILPALIAAL